MQKVLDMKSVVVVNRCGYGWYLNTDYLMELPLSTNQLLKNTVGSGTDWVERVIGRIFSQGIKTISPALLPLLALRIVLSSVLPSSHDELISVRVP
jgi:hypothetical protein